MRRATISLSLTVLCWGMHSFQAQAHAVAPDASPPAASQAAAAPATVDAPKVDASATADKAAPAAGQPTGSDAWRFKWHRGAWWYWLPAEKWVVWTGDRWAPYTPAAVQQFQASRPRRANANSQGETGFWGPVRYDGYGNRQYPYSRRSSGIKQLGPVPAMGGVRAMPGWGGER